MQLGEKRRSVMGQLISELSWSGKRIRRYRNGGAGYENVLTAEVFQILDFLPREHFFGAIINSMQTCRETIQNQIYEEIEAGEFTLLPGNFYLKENPKSHQEGYAVQPDAILETPSVYCVIEVKRIKRSQFLRHQLSKEFYLATREAGKKIPFLFLVLREGPPIPVKGSGRIAIKDEIVNGLEAVHDIAQNHSLSVSQLKALAADHYGWITWPEIKDTISEQLGLYSNDSYSTRKSIERLCNGIIDAIDRHS